MPAESVAEPWPKSRLEPTTSVADSESKAFTPVGMNSMVVNPIALRTAKTP